MIASRGAPVARLYLDSRVAVAEFDARAEEVTGMTSFLLPQKTANRREWDEALAGHTAAERRAADVYTLHG